MGIVRLLLWKPFSVSAHRQVREPADAEDLSALAIDKVITHVATCRGLDNEDPAVGAVQALAWAHSWLKITITQHRRARKVRGPRLPTDEFQALPSDMRRPDEEAEINDLSGTKKVLLAAVHRKVTEIMRTGRPADLYQYALDKKVSVDFMLTRRQIDAHELSAIMDPAAIARRLKLEGDDLPGQVYRLASIGRVALHVGALALLREETDDQVVELLTDIVRTLNRTPDRSDK